ncbi:MAG: hypothetical protein HKN04_05715 [Rhodothermaceae bacterium]|nr:hypothetical protein [Rhodothermaceae bacterium]
MNDGTLRIPGGPLLVTVTSDRFRNPSGALSFMSQDEFELHFLSQDAFNLISMEGESTPYRRAQPYAPTAADLEDFGGHWESDELRSVLEMAPRDDGLAIRLNDSRPFDFAPIAPDTFQRGRMTIRFRRDEDGKVVVLDYSNPMLRNVTFTRRSDGTRRR